MKEFSVSCCTGHHSVNKALVPQPQKEGMEFHKAFVLLEINLEDVYYKCCQSFLNVPKNCSESTTRDRPQGDFPVFAPERECSYFG